MVGYYVTESGPLNLVVHLWAYDSLDQRDKCRAAMTAGTTSRVRNVRTRECMGPPLLMVTRELVGQRVPR